jgi:uncharacterized protein YjiS (DUF1127 family)
MHTITQQSTAERLVVRAGYLVLWLGELSVALVWHATARLVTWQERAREGRRLASLDDYLLRDMGLSRSQIDVESRKHFWQS